MSKNLDLIKKYVKIKGRYHKQLRALSYKYDIPIEKVIDIILEDALKDESKFDELFQSKKDRLKHFNVCDDHITIKDKVEDRLVDVYIRDRKLGCEFCQSTECIHVDYAWSIPKVDGALINNLRYNPIFQ